MALQPQLTSRCHVPLRLLSLPCVAYLPSKAEKEKPEIAVDRPKLLMRLLSQSAPACASGTHVGFLTKSSVGFL